MKKLVNKKGFTLVEMLIVVAIIAILAVIAIPSMTDSLDKANAGTDAANLRTAKSVYATAVAGASTEVVTALENDQFNTDSGTFVEAGSGSTGKCKAHQDAYITIKDGKVVWVDKDGNEVADCGSTTDEATGAAVQ